ncbi:uncharacterized protein LOC121516647 isoform X2 [Cheilinus undulatus]|uniref:uncharacterized protein LOC121516647 isoform X2 n=1 Tax=Cheilinus undulatus TaxID=241271 RepID=UPI001BD1E763|nr:uncharacterized protein LOC121516647 isoform X2 [Cheilinus undulatus]
MLVVFYFLVMLRVGGCMNDGIFDNQTVVVGDEVNMKCETEASGSFYWIRLGSRNFPEYLGKSFNIPNLNSHITITTDNGLLTLHIKKAQLRDTGLYYCLSTSQRTLTFLTGTNLTVTAKPAVPTVLPPGPVLPVDPVPPEESKEKTCPGEHSVCCYRAGSHQLYPGLNREISAENQQNPAGLSVKKCICSFIQNSSATDPGTCLCAVDSCEEILENRSNTKDQVNKDSQTSLLLCAALAVCLIIIACLIYFIRNLKKSSCGCFTAETSLQRERETGSSDQQNQQADEDSLIYSAPTFTKRKTVKAETKDVKSEEKESVYAHVMFKEMN